MMNLDFKLLPNGILPIKSRVGDAGYDIFLPDDVIISANNTSVIDSGVCVKIPENYAGMMVIRSSIAKTGLIIQPPLIDSNYTGEIHIIVTNPTNTDFKFKRGERICSLLVFPIFSGLNRLVDELPETNRGSNWSGSSGK